MIGSVLLPGLIGCVMGIQCLDDEPHYKFPLADLFAGYPAYALATFVIKGIVALIGYVVYRKNNLLFAILSAVLAEAFMALSYFVFEWLLMGYGFGAIAGIPANCVQGAVGAVLAIVLLKLFTNSKPLSEFFGVFKTK